MGTYIFTYVAVTQHGPLSLYTKLEGPRIAKFGFMFTNVQPLDHFLGSLDFMLMALGMCISGPQYDIAS